MARTAPGEIKAALPADPPQSPEPFDAILADLDRIVMPGLSHFQHPNFFGYFPSNGELSSVLGDYVSTGLGVLGLSYVAGLGRAIGHSLAIGAILSYALAVGWQPSVVRAAVAGTFRVAPALIQPLYAPELVAYSAGSVLTIAPQ